MCLFTATHLASEALLRFEDRTLWLAVERSCGCVTFTPASLADLDRGLALIEGSADTESADEPAVPALALAA
jgi:hypothetical protein